MTDYAIETHGLTRYYGTRAVVQQLNLQVPRGSIFAFLGRNGAGKSTTIRMLMGLVEPTRGSANVLGYDCQKLPPEARSRIGYLAEGHHVYGWMTVAECCSWQASFFPHWNQRLFNGVIDHFGLDPKMDAKNLSRGQRAGLCLALTLAPEPELLILDDPALGLDPVARRSLLQAMIYVTRGEGRTILFSSHLLSDVERVADRLAILDNGVLRASCSVETFRNRVRQFVLHFPGVPPEMPPLPGVIESLRSQGELAVTFANLTDESYAALETLGASRIEAVELGMEEACIAYLGDRGEKSFFLESAETNG